MSASFQMPASSFRGGVALIAAASSSSFVFKLRLQLLLQVRVIPVLICAQDAHQSCVCAVCVVCGVLRVRQLLRGPQKEARLSLSALFSHFVGVGGQAFCCCRRFSAKGVAERDRQTDGQADGKADRTGRQTDKAGGHNSQL